MALNLPKLGAQENGLIYVNAMVETIYNQMLSRLSYNGKFHWLVYFNSIQFNS